MLKRDLHFVASAAMFVCKELFLLLCCCSLAVSSRLRREGVGKEAELDDILKVAKHAHAAGDIYVNAKKSFREGSAAENIYLVCVFL